MYVTSSPPDDPLAAFTPRELARLLGMRQRHLAGLRTEWPREYARLRFYRWLYERGRLDA